MVSDLLQLVHKSIYGITTGFNANVFRHFSWFESTWQNINGNSPLTRSQPVESFQWGTDTVISVRFNPGDPNLLAASARYA